MTLSKHQFDSDDLGHELDLLIDGELSDDRRRELLLRLENTGDGWRRCALAFLESQAWRETLRLGADILAIETAPPVSMLAARPAAASTWSRSGGKWFALAASVALAFGLGVMSRSASQAPSIAQQPMRAGHNCSRSAVEQATGGARAASDEHEPVETETSEFWLAGSTDSDGALASTVPADLREQLEESGHRFEQRQELWPVELQDGRRAILPVERLDIRYVGNDYF